MRLHWIENVDINYEDLNQVPFGNTHKTPKVDQECGIRHAETRAELFEISVINLVRLF